MRDEKVMQPQLSRSYRMPSARTAKPNQSEALDLLSYILGGGSSSRLYKNLVMEKGIAANAGCYYSGTAYDEGRFMIYATPLENISLETLEDAVDASINALIQNISDEEITRAKTRLVAESIYAQDKQVTLAQIYGASLATGSTIDDVQNWAFRVKKITKADILAETHLLNKNLSVSGHLLPLETN
jgi:zinc protease